VSQDPVMERRSIRKYTDQAVGDDVVERLLRAAMCAPSAGNQQPWQFVVLRDRETLGRVPAAHPYAAMVPSAALAIVVCGTPEDCRWPSLWPQDCSAATENILIEATALGLGSVWCSIHPMEERERGMREVLGIPEEIVPFSIVALGHAAEAKPPADRYDEARVHHDRW
jgi:nitroreductase